MSFPQQFNGSPIQPAYQYSPILDLKSIPNPRIVMSYRKATYADVLAAGDDTYRRLLNTIDWEGRKVPVHDSLVINSETSSEGTDTAEERESSEDGGQLSPQYTRDVWNRDPMPPPGHEEVIQEASFEPMPHNRSTPLIPMNTKLPTYHVLPNLPVYSVNTGPPSIFRPNPTPVYHHPKPIQSAVAGSSFQQMTPPPAHQPTLQPVHQPAVLQPIQNLNHVVWNGTPVATQQFQPQPQLQPLQMVQQQQQQHHVPQQFNGQVLMVYTKPVINPKPQVIRLVQRNVAAVGTNPGI